MVDVAQTLDTTKADLVANFVQRELKAKVSLLQTVMDVSRFCTLNAKSISFPKMTSYSVTNRTVGSQGFASALTDSVDKLELSYNAFSAGIIDSSDLIQSSLEWKMEMLARQASAHGRYVDGSIISVMSGSHCDYINTLASAANITEANVITLRKGLVQNNAPTDQMYLAVSADQEAVFLGISNFIDASKYGEANIQTGVIGKIFGMKVIVNTQLPAKTVYAYASEGIAVGFQKAPAVAEQADVSYGTGGLKVAMDQLFGVKALETAAGKKLDGTTDVAAGKSALIFALNATA